MAQRRSLRRLRPKDVRMYRYRDRARGARARACLVASFVIHSTLTCVGISFYLCLSLSTSLNLTSCFSLSLWLFSFLFSLIVASRRSSLSIRLIVHLSSVARAAHTRRCLSVKLSPGALSLRITLSPSLHARRIVSLHTDLLALKRAHGVVYRLLTEAHTPSWPRCQQWMRWWYRQPSTTMMYLQYH